MVRMAMVMGTVSFVRGLNIVIGGCQWVVADRCQTGIVKLYDPREDFYCEVKESILAQMIVSGELLAVSANDNYYHHYQEYDWIVLDQALKDETTRRLMYVLRYLDMATPKQRSIVICHKIINSMVHIYGAQDPPNARILLDWVQLYAKREDWRSLVPRKAAKKPSSWRLHTKVEAIIKRVMEEVYQTPQWESKQYIHQRIAHLIFLENCWRKPEDQLGIPHWSTITRRIRQFGH